jgi:hypothetical protein
LGICGEADDGQGALSRYGLAGAGDYSECSGKGTCLVIYLARVEIGGGAILSKEITFFDAVNSDKGGVEVEVELETGQSGIGHYQDAYGELLS